MAASLTTEQLNTLTVDATLGREKPSIPGEEAAEAYEALKAQVAKIKAAGWMVEMLKD